MFLVYKPRRSWVRTATHTVVPERSPDFERFLADPSGEVETYLRIWIAEGKRSTPKLVSYVGGLWLRPDRLPPQDVERLEASVVRAVGTERGRPLVRMLHRQLASRVRREAERRASLHLPD